MAFSYSSTNVCQGSDGGDTKLTNQFSFVERATQTMNNALKVVFYCKDIGIGDKNN